MESLGNLIRKHVTSIQLLLLAGGFVITLAELILLGHTKGIQLVAIGSTVAGILLALWGLISTGNMRKIVAMLFVLLSLTGLIGTFEHLEEGDEAGEARLTVPTFNNRQGSALNVALNAQEDDEGSEGSNAQPNTERTRPFAGAVRREGRGGVGTPPLAPLSLSGLALFGAVTLLGYRKDEQQ